MAREERVPWPEPAPLPDYQAEAISKLTGPVERVEQERLHLVECRLVRGRAGAVHMYDMATDDLKTLCGRTPLEGTMYLVDDKLTCSRCRRSAELRGWRERQSLWARLHSFLTKKVGV